MKYLAPASLEQEPGPGLSWLMEGEEGPRAPAWSSACKAAATAAASLQTGQGRHQDRPGLYHDLPTHLSEPLRPIRGWTEPGEPRGDFEILLLRSWARTWGFHFLASVPGSKATAWEDHQESLAVTRRCCLSERVTQRKCRSVGWPLDPQGAGPFPPGGLEGVCPLV